MIRRILLALLIFGIAQPCFAQAGPNKPSQYTPPCYSGGAPCNGTNQPSFPPYVAGSILLNPAPNTNSTYYGTLFGQIPPVGGDGTILAIKNGAWTASPPGASGFITPNLGGTGVNNGANTITLGGNLVTGGAFTQSGAFNTTITSTATSNFTLPPGNTTGMDNAGLYAALPDLRFNIGVAAYPPISADFDPARHLSNLIGKTTAHICAVGDSTMTVGPTGGNAVDPSQAIWGMLQTHLRNSNPQITTWDFAGNYAIGGTNENLLFNTGSGGGLGTLPAWFTDLSKTWIYYIQNNTQGTGPCDVLFYLFGTNQAGAGSGGTPAAATFIDNNMAAIDAWIYKPNIEIITNKFANPANDATGDDSRQAFHRAQASFHRTFARSNGAGYTTFPNLQAIGFGLVDLGRNFDARVALSASLTGIDTAAQYLQAATITSGLSFSTTPITVGSTTDGDFRLTLVFPRAGGVGGLGLPDLGAILIKPVLWPQNYLRIVYHADGSYSATYTLDGAISGSPTQHSADVPTTLGQDLTVTASEVGDRIQVWFCGTLTGGAAAQCGDANNPGTLALDIVGSRYMAGAAGGTPIQISSSVAPSGSPTFNVHAFFVGIAAKTTSIMTATTAFGGDGPGVTACTPAQVGCQGGNSANHQASISEALDREAISALNFHVPPLTTPTSCRAVASLDSAGIAGRRSCVNDQLTACPALGGTFTGGGVVVCPAFDNGTTWVMQ